MDIVKKNIVSIILGVVALVAIVAAFVPLGGYIQQTNDKLGESQKLHTDASSLLTKKRQMPQVPGVGPLELNRVPNQAVINAGKDIVKRLQEESTEIYNAALALNKKELLVPGSLPQPERTQDWLFRQQYQQQMPRLLEMLDATFPLDQGRLTQEATRIAEEVKKERAIMVGGVLQNPAELQELINRRLEGLPIQLRARLAQDHKVYIARDAITLSNKIAGTGRLDPVDMWWAQVGLWFYEELIGAINNANRDAQNVLDAPIKHIIALRDVDAGKFAPGVSGGSPTAAIPTNFGLSPTGRQSNGMFEMKRYELEAAVEVEDIPLIIKRMTDNRLLSVYEIDIESVDSAAALLEGAVYGSKPVARVVMRGEVLFLKDWMAPYVPEAVKSGATGNANASGQPGGGPPGGPPPGYGGPGGPPRR